MQKPTNLPIVKYKNEVSQNISRAKYVFIWPTLLSLSFILFIVDIANPINDDDYIILASFILIFIISSVNLFLDNKPYSINKFFWIFNIIFFSFTPTIQYINSSLPWEGNRYAQNIHIEANVLIIICLLIYRIVYILTSRSAKKKIRINPSLFNRRTTSYNSIGFLIFLLFCIIVIKVQGFGALWLRAHRESYGNGDQTTGLVINSFLRSYILYYTVLTIALYKDRKVSKLWLVVILVISIVLNFPTALPRYFAAAFYFSIFFSFVRNIKRKNLVSLVILSMLLFVFPILSGTRNVNFSIVNIFHHFSKFLSNGFVGADFDAYSMLCATLKYVQIHGATNGHQLLGPIFFFIPRNMWPTKPYGSGYFVGNALNWDFLNISSPYLAEGVVNFGIVGAIIWVVVLGYVISRYDIFYWKMVENGLIRYYWVLLYPALMGMLFFMFRGDLLSSSAYLTGLLVIALLCHYILNFKFIRLAVY